MAIALRRCAAANIPACGSVPLPIAANATSVSANTRSPVAAPSRVSFSRNSQMTSAAPAFSRPMRQASFVETQRTSLMTSSERPGYTSTSTTEHSSRRAPKRLAGLRTPLATARI